jgi:glycosyltransferase involved in cell wall biosynthesis
VSKSAGSLGATVRRPRSGTLRLLLLTNMWPTPDDPSFGSFVSRHVAALRETGVDVTVVANETRRRGKISNLRKYASLLHRSRRAAATGAYDIVCGHFLYPTAFVSRVAAARAGTPYILVAHGTDVRSLARKGPIARLCRRALNGAALLVTVSEDLARRARGDLLVPPTVPIEVVNMGVDTELFRPDPTARTRLGVQASERLLLFVGNLILDKGVDVLLHAFSDLRQKDAVDRLVVVGSGPLGDTLRERAGRSAPDLADGSSEEAVTFLGTLPHRDLPAWMAAADVLVLPSRREGLGLVLLEAMACGTPCVASRVGGIPEILSERCGELVPPDDPAALALAIERVMSTGKAHYGRACRETALDHTIEGQALRFRGLAEDVTRRA